MGTYYWKYPPYMAKKMANAIKAVGVFEFIPINIKSSPKNYWS